MRAVLLSQSGCGFKAAFLHLRKRPFPDPTHVGASGTRSAHLFLEMERPSFRCVPFHIWKGVNKSWYASSIFPFWTWCSLLVSDSSANHEFHHCSWNFAGPSFVGIAADDGLGSNASILEGSDDDDLDQLLRTPNSDTVSSRDKTLTPGRDSL